jgi:hypothetical protein
MNGSPESDGSQSSAAVDRIREQIAEDRRELADTISALHSKTDVKKRVRDKAASVEIAAADAVGRVGRTACSLPHLAKSAAHQAQHQAAEQGHKISEPVRAPVGSAAGLLRRRLDVVLAAWAALMALAVATRWWRGR